MKRVIPLIIFLVAFAGAFLYLEWVEEPVVEKVEVPEISFEEVQEPEGSDTRQSVTLQEQNNVLTDVTPDEVELVEPDPIIEFNLAIPWTPQAPHAVWDHRDQEACEEASIYMVDLYYQGVSSGLVDPDTAGAAIQELVDKQMDMFGYFESTTAEQTAQLVETYYGYSTELLQEPTIDQIKDEILAGHPVVVPMAGQVLANPYFTPPGPEYHMLVIKGFTEEGFITNDPGTRHGENWLYEYDHFMNSIHDYVADDILSGKKVVIVIQK